MPRPPLNLCWRSSLKAPCGKCVAMLRLAPQAWASCLAAVAHHQGTLGAVTAWLVDALVATIAELTPGIPAVQQVGHQAFVDDALAQPLDLIGQRGVPAQRVRRAASAAVITLSDVERVRVAIDGEWVSEDHVSIAVGSREYPVSSLRAATTCTWSRCRMVTGTCVPSSLNSRDMPSFFASKPVRILLSPEGPAGP